MGWAANYIGRLKAGETVQFRPRGNSMTGIIESGQLVTVVPIHPGDPVAKGDVVLCKVHGTEYLHIVKAERNGVYQIGNNRGGINGWTARANLFGKYIGKELDQ